MLAADLNKTLSRWTYVEKFIATFTSHADSAVEHDVSKAHEGVSSFRKARYCG